MNEKKQIIQELVEKFERNLDEYKHPSYNETLIRVEFVNPFWKALGWDVDNTAGYALAYRDVFHEDEVKVGPTSKAPDYSFRIGGARKFFLETKKPSVDLKNDPAPAFQLRRYAYSAKLPVSILTDFEEFVVYDCRVKPAITDKPSVSRVICYHYRDYMDKWDEISAVFSKEAVMRGSFDRFAEGSKGKRGTAEIDRDFLGDLDEWRMMLARNIALRNPKLSERELNYAVQMTIDRLIFLRMCEDRGIETRNTLQSLLNGERVYRRLVEIYYEADRRYNSGLFHFEKVTGASSPADNLTPSLSVDDKVLKDIIGELYYPRCPYEFSILPVEILGNAYEQFLGKVIRLTEGHHAKIEEKPEVRKAGGVYYTPQYIVDYIVKNTVGKLCEGKTPAEVSDLRILDPACGSGSFLLGAYKYLMDWHLEYYKAEHEKTGKIPTVLPDKGKRQRKLDPYLIFKGIGEDWYLTTAEKKRILTNNLYGVDIDANAVEVTKLSLLLKVLEGENSETLSRQLGLWHERALPDLGGNIKCGNSLIGSDFFESGQAALFDEPEMNRVNAFDWDKEFPEIFTKGGFDAVIGNPPYVRQEGLGEFKPYFQKNYKVYHGVADLYAYFIEKGIKLLKDNGHFSYIVANKWMRANYGKPLRQWLKNQHLEELIDFGDLQVFQGATTYPCILKVAKEISVKSFQAVKVDSLKFINLSDHVKILRYKVNQMKLDDMGWSLSNEAEQKLLEKLNQKGIPLEEFVKGKIYYGIKTGLNEAFVITAEKRKEMIKQDPKSAELIKPFLAGQDIKRYARLKADEYVLLIPKGWTNQRSNYVKNAWGWLEKNYKGITKHLEPYKEKAEKRFDKGEYWWELRACEYYDEFEKTKIIYPNILKKPEFAFDVDKNYTNQKCFIIPIDDKYLLGILNSKIDYFFFQMILPKLRGGFFEPSYVFFKDFPIRVIDIENPDDVKMQDHIVTLVEQILGLNKRLTSAKDTLSKDMLQRQIDATERQIDRLVYKLYDLTDEEIRIVEEGVK